MAVLNPASATALLYHNGSADTVCLYGLRNVSAGDTIDLGSSGAGQFLTVERAVVVGLVANVQAACAISGTVVTMPGGLGNASGYLLAWGSSS